MANLENAKKANRSAINKKRRNDAMRTKVHDSMQKVEKLAEADAPKKEIEEAVAQAHKSIDKAVKAYLPKNKAARLKAQISKKAL
jgi:ribosomal protein S20